MHTTWRKCLRDVWHLPYRAHSCLLPALSGSLCSKHTHMKRFVKLACNALQHRTDYIRFLFKVSAEIPNSIFAMNLNYVAHECGIDFHSLADLQANSSIKTVVNMCYSNCHTLNCRINSTAVRELAMMRDGLSTSIFNLAEIQILLDNLCCN